jgi:hypothetical protein
MKRATSGLGPFSSATTSCGWGCSIYSTYIPRTLLQFLQVRLNFYVNRIRNVLFTADGANNRLECIPNEYDEVRNGECASKR